jgi:V8-like Glu-specific endopeptidase
VMSWNDASVEQLQTAVESFDRPDVDRLCTELVAHLRNSESPPSVDEARRVLALLQRKRHFQHLQRVADAFVHNGLDLPFVRRRYAQALLDQEMLTAGLSILGGLIETSDDAEELAEARGLVGRANKQLYVLTGTSAGQRRHAYLQRAIDAYNQVYQADQQTQLWHGINTAALLKLAASDGVDVPGFPDPGERGGLIARQVLDVIMAKPEQDTWDRATAMEACVALDRAEDALRWLDSYVDGPYTDAFELGSTLRQLIEVWRLRGDREPGARLLPLLRAKLLEREGGEITVRPSDLGRGALDQMIRRQHLERVFGAERFQSLGWFKDALERCRAVARIEDEYEDGIGTGFLVDGTALHATFPGVVLVTNAHVIPEDIAHQDAFITFRALGDGPDAGHRHQVQDVLWTSPRDELDATVVSLQSEPAGVTPCPTAGALPPLDSSPPPRAFIVGHPSGRVLPMFSIQDNLMLDYDGTRVHYRAPTEPGSSGSPVFDRRWKLIALHHSGSDEMPMLHGGGTYQANEGIWVGRIKEAIQHDLERRGA